MQGLALSKCYYQDVVAPMLARRFPTEVSRMAVGLVGDGSECYGYDDTISQDHDWGPAICIWLTTDDYNSLSAALNQALSELPDFFMGYPSRNTTALGQGRTGALMIGAFYRKYLGLDHVPETLGQWRLIPENHLSTATNGAVFTDPLGEFTAIRDKLLQGYPEDIRKKKIAARCMTMAQAGQYNYPRILARHDTVAAYLAEAEWLKAAISIIYLLNNSYQPYYKWMHHGLQTLPILGMRAYHLLNDLMAPHTALFDDQEATAKTQLIEEFCQLTADELRRQHLSDSTSDFLLDHGYSVHQKIADPTLRQSNPWVE